MTSDVEVFDSSGLSDEIDDDEFTNEETNPQQHEDGVDEDEKLIEETRDSNFADAMNKILASSVDGKENPVLAKRKLNYADEKKERREKLRELHAQRLEKKRIAELGHVLPSSDEKDVEKALRKVATKGVTALFNAIKRSKRALPDIEEQDKPKRKKEKKMTSSDALKKKLEESTTKLAQTPKETKWAVLDDNMIENKVDMQNWDTMEGVEDDWDED